MSHSTHLNPNLIDWSDLPDKAFKYKGKKTDVSLRLRTYLMTLREKGMGMNAAASHSGISYVTIRKQRKENGYFALLERSAQDHGIGDVNLATFENAKDRNSKNQVAAARFWMQHVHSWKDPIHNNDELKEHIAFSIENWSRKDQAHARAFLRNVDKYARREAEDE